MLRAKRWSTTRIAEAIGVSDETVRQDLSGSNNLEPESPVTGQDGKSYPSSLPAPSLIADRRDRAQELREQGQSMPRIAEVIGVDDETVRRDLSAVNNLTAESPVTGQDGKYYPSSLPAPSPGRPTVRGGRHWSSCLPRQKGPGTPTGRAPMAPLACASSRASEAARRSTRRGARTAPCQAGARGLHRSQTGPEPIALARSPPPAGGHQVTPARQPVRPLLGGSSE